MDYLKFEFLKKCESELIKGLPVIFDVFASEIDTKLVVQSASLSWIEVYFINFEKKRSIQVIISEGVNADNKQAYNINFNIQKISSERVKISSFSIKDYCYNSNIPIKLDTFFIEIPNFFIVLKEYIERINKILQLEDLESVLFSDKWIEVKPNFHPYK